MYDLHIGLHEDTLTDAMRESLTAFATEHGGALHLDGDAWQEWGGVPGNVSADVDLALRHVVFRFEGREYGASHAIADAVSRFPVRMMRRTGRDRGVIALATNSHDWSHVHLTLTAERGY